MDRKLTEYQAVVQNLLTERVDWINGSKRDGIDCITVFDEKQGHYFVHTIGWRDIERIWTTSLYIRLADDKIWIEIDWTEEGFANELLAAGVPREDIVLAFHHPRERKYTEFAVA